MVSGALLCAVLAAPPMATSRADAPPAPGEVHTDVVLAAYPAFAAGDELLRRFLSPLTRSRILERLAHSGQKLSKQSLDPAQERFALYVPPGPPPPDGYALLVFVPPWEDARVPPQWVPALDRQKTIFVSAARSGNDDDVFDRREPLALVAEYNVAQRYPVNPEHIYVAGFSGGASVALRLALAYPDVFRGALLDAGGESVGTAQVPLPPADLFHRFQETTRVVYVEGTDDAGPAADSGMAPETARPAAPPTGLYEATRQGAGVTLYLSGQAARAHADRSSGSRNSLKRWCVANVDHIAADGVGHQLVDAKVLERALVALRKPVVEDPSGLSACRHRNEGDMGALLEQARQLSARNKPDEARKLLEGVDAQYGGLAAPGTVELMRRLDTPH